MRLIRMKKPDGILVDVEDDKILHSLSKGWEIKQRGLKSLRKSINGTKMIFLLDGDDISFFIYKEKDLIGNIFGDYDKYERIMIIEIMEIAPKYRGKGYGSLAYKEFEKMLKSIGVKKISLRDDNDQDFWIKMNFRTDKSFFRNSIEKTHWKHKFI